MQPKKILLFIVGVLIALFAMTFFSRYHTTASGMVREGIVFGNNAMLRYPTPDILGMLFKNTEKENKRLDELIKKTEGSIVDEKTKTLTENDSLVKDSLYKLESNTEGKIYYPGNKIDYLKQLKAKLHQSSCQIVHYGD